MAGNVLAYGMLESDIAWFAGFFEGEGSVSLGGNRHRNVRVYAVPVIDITQVNEEPLLKAHKIFPGAKIYGPYDRNIPGRSPQYRFVITGRAKVQSVFTQIEPYLSEKRRMQFITTLDAHAKLIDRPRLKTGPKSQANQMEL